MTFQSSIMEKKSTFLDEMIYITFKCVVHLHGHWNKMVPFMKPFILANFSNDVKFHNYTSWSTNDIHNHHLSHQVNNHHIGNKNLVFTSHLKIGL